MSRREHANTPAQTRKSDAVRKRHRGQQRPLPFDLQVLPPIKKRLPRHPECVTDKTAHHWRMEPFRTLTTEQFVSGVGLCQHGRFALYVQGRKAGATDDALDALAWRSAARVYFHMEATILDNGS